MRQDFPDGNAAWNRLGVGNLAGRAAGRLCAVLLPPVFLVFLFLGCREPLDVPPVAAQVVEAYGVTLDEAATPQQVVYVLLRSLRDDVEAAQAGDRTRQRQAFRITFSLAAFDEVERRLGLSAAASRDDHASEDRARRLHEVIHHWAPIVAHYVRSFQPDPDSAMKAMRTTIASDQRSARVNVEVCHDPSEPQADKQQRAVLDIELVKQKATVGAGEYWRVARVAFRGPKAPEHPPGPSTAPAVEAAPAERPAEGANR